MTMKISLYLIKV